ncbi:guanylate kinase [Pleomorphomonas sp. JP5]|uniref:guanylate kinase n=1 Tax=Pleomorphomonas sp. JP5 TaxID=2942998 RepID=UPI0020442816|nr:guanylate kinase [Pleomorphomonas sp. JP5]MCM5558365.1 guanylate kinase [Pleomorphomonas sp. JP5]
MTDQKHVRFPRRGLMFVISSPSGAGKGTLSRNILDTDRDMTLSISVTTRDRRPSEINGVHYHFISQQRFLSMRDGGELLEWAEVHGNYYGTPHAPVEEALASGRDVLFDIDWQGAAQLREKMAADVVSVFILPPSMAELRSRLTRRAEDAPEVIEKRLVNARREIAEWSNFDYVVVNDDLDAAFADLTAILRAERSRRSRAAEGIEGFVGALLA